MRPVRKGWAAGIQALCLAGMVRRGLSAELGCPSLRQGPCTVSLEKVALVQT